MKSVFFAGNIAQNSFHNANLLNASGFDCWILSNDQYHLNSSPEQLHLLKSSNGGEANLGSDFFPNYFQFGNLKAIRPRWFVSGPTHMCLNYLWLSKTGQNELADLAWCVLQYQRFKIVALQRHDARHDIWSASDFDAALTRLKVADEYRQELTTGFECEKWLLAYSQELSIHTRQELSPQIFPLLDSYLDVHFPIARGGEELDLTALRFAGRSIAMGIERFPAQAKDEVVSKELAQIDYLKGMVGIAAHCSAVLKLFDYRVMTSNTPIYAEISNSHPYAAFEHGTLRALPFQDSDNGRSVAHGYQAADVVMITNADYVNASRKLELDADKIVYIPHGFPADNFDALLSKPKAKMNDEVITFFAPARHLWVEKGTGSEKGNDRVVKAIQLLKDSGETKFNVLIVDHGVDAPATKELAKKLDVEDYITWIPRQSYTGMWSLISKSHAVIDQFIIPALGAIGVEALALGSRLINHDDGSLEVFFGKRPAMLPAHTDTDIAAAMKAVIDDPTDEAGIGDAAREWFQKYHSKDFVRQQFLLTFEKLDAARETKKYGVETGCPSCGHFNTIVTFTAPNGSEQRACDACRLVMIGEHAS